MAQAEFNEKVKLNVKDNFDQSCQIYNAFEEKHHFFASLALKLAESINLKHGSHRCWMWAAEAEFRRWF